MAAQLQTFDSMVADETARILWRAVEAVPEDMVAKGALADRLDEIDVLPYLAESLRWCMRRGKYPQLLSDENGKGYAAWSRESSTEDQHSPHHLPRPVFDMMGGADANANEFVAYLGVAISLRLLRKVID